MNIFKIAAGTLLFTSLFSAAAETPTERDERMAWFRDARFGMFIHWGVYSVPAGEWDGKTHYGEWFMEETKMPVSQYEKFADQFNPEKFDAAEWVRMAKDAGTKYLVLTSKHHDGFALWPSDLTDWCITRTPFKRDPLQELAEACRKEGITLCFYHSIMDWHHPDWGTRRAWNDKAAGSPDMERYIAYLKGQLKELVTRYGPLGIMWFDGEWESAWTHERGQDLYDYVRGLQPDIIINNRVGKGRSGMAGMDKGPEGVGDYGTPEQEIPPTGFGPGVDWESCMTMNNHWGYNKHDHNWKSSTTLVRNLIDCASKGGNYLLNVGPTAEGLFPRESIERLAEIGSWMKVNGEAIYGTSASPFRRLPFGRCTRKLEDDTSTLYLHVFDWPKDGKLAVRGLMNEVATAYLLADRSHKPLAADLDDTGLTVTVPSAAPDPHASVVVLKVNGALRIEDPGVTQAPDGTLTLTAMDARTHGERLQYEPGQARESLGFWTDASDWADWEATIKKPGRFAVSADIASLGNSSFTLNAADQSLKARSAATGDYGVFKTFNLGTLTISKAGKVTISIEPVEEKWSAINLRAIRFRPVE